MDLGGGGGLVSLRCSCQDLVVKVGESAVQRSRGSGSGVRVWGLGVRYRHWAFAGRALRL